MATQTGSSYICEMITALHQWNVNLSASLCVCPSVCACVSLSSL